MFEELLSTMVPADVLELQKSKYTKSLKHYFYFYMLLYVYR